MQLVTIKRTEEDKRKVLDRSSIKLPTELFSDEVLNFRVPYPYQSSDKTETIGDLMKYLAMLFMDPVDVYRRVAKMLDVFNDGVAMLNYPNGTKQLLSEACVQLGRKHIRLNPGCYMGLSYLEAHMGTVNRPRKSSVGRN